jgi:pantetheine-phosphate adenylyltransferase
MRKAIFSGSFDPFTLGHLDIVVRASNIFDKVTIAIAKSNSKNSYFTLEDRVKIVQKSISKLDNQYLDKIEVISFDGLLVDLLKSQNSTFIIRGLRNSTDYDYEVAMENANKKLLKECETIYLQTSPKYSYISSSIVKSIMINDGDISKMVEKNALKTINKIRNKIDK